MLYRKIVNGDVVQIFNDYGECIEQNFICSDLPIVYETGDGLPINAKYMPFNGNEYYPYNMTQPNSKIVQ